MPANDGSFLKFPNDVDFKETAKTIRGQGAKEVFLSGRRSMALRQSWAHLEDLAPYKPVTNSPAPLSRAIWSGIDYLEARM